MSLFYFLTCRKLFHMKFAIFDVARCRMSATSLTFLFETLPKFHWFFANVNARSNLAGIIRVFGHVVRDLQRNHPTAARDVMRTTRVWSKVERSRACAPLTKTQVHVCDILFRPCYVRDTKSRNGIKHSVQ